MNQLDKEALGEKIKILRTNAGKSQAELGQALGKSHAAVSDIERGITEITVRDLSIIANFLNVTMIDLLSGSKPQEQNYFVQYRDSKDTTPEDKKENDKASLEFLKYAREHAKKIKSI